MSVETVADWESTLAPASPGGRPAKGHSGRMRKLECDGCGMKLYATSYRAVRDAGMPACGCGGSFTVANLRDRAKIERDTLEDELIEAGREAFNAAARELGWAQWHDDAGAAARRAERDNRHGFISSAANCGVCGRFKSRPADRCDYCGDEPATYGATAGERREAERIHNRGQGYAG